MDKKQRARVRLSTVGRFLARPVTLGVLKAAEAWDGASGRAYVAHEQRQARAAGLNIYDYRAKRREEFRAKSDEIQSFGIVSKAEKARWRDRFIPASTDKES